MAQYLLSVHSVDGEIREPMSDEEMQQSWKQIQVLEEELKSTGAWVFSGRLHDPDTATVVRMSGGEVLTTVGPFAETKEHLVGFYVIEADTAGRPSSSSRRPHLEGLSECAHRSASESSQRIHVGRLSKR